MSRPLGLLLLTAALGGLASAGRAQQPAPAPSGKCDLEIENLPATHTQTITQPTGDRNVFIGGGVRAYCRAQGMQLVSDSLEYYEGPKLLHFIGHVHYIEPRVTLDSDLLTYWMGEERLRAEGAVHATLPSGTTLSGPTVDYYRAAPGIRAVARMVAPGRPTIQLVQADSTGKAQEPVIVIANTVVMDGDSVVYASGKVEITRPDLIATADSAAMDSERGVAHLVRQPVITGRGERPFTLSGRVIDLFEHDRVLDRVLSSGSAKAVSQDVTLTADTLDMRFTDRLLQRAQAWGASRAHAVSSSYDIVADSLDVRMPAQRVDEVRAIRNAFAQSDPDSTRIRSGQRDWMRGDTIVASFDTARARPAAQPSGAPADSAARNQPRIKQLVAQGNASSYYQIAPRDSTVAQPAVNYVRGKTITVSFLNRAVQTVTILGKAVGVYLEPGVSDSAAVRPPASTGRRP